MGRLPSLHVHVRLDLVGEDELHELDGVVDPIGALRHRHDVAACEGGRLAGLQAGEQGDPELDVGVLLLGQGDVEVAGAHDPDVARAEHLAERRAGLRLGGGSIRPSWCIIPCLEHRRDAVADERLVAALGRLDRAARRPDQRANVKMLQPAQLPAR